MPLNFLNIASRINQSLINVKDKDSFLIKNGQERALSHKLGLYICDCFPDWDVDCEYNRTGLGEQRKLDTNRSVKTPDIIIHHRGQSKLADNLLWVEVKIDNQSCQDDIDKLKEFTSDPTGDRIIQYQYGLSISFMRELKLTWIINGATIPI